MLNTKSFKEKDVKSNRSSCFCLEMLLYFLFQSQNIIKSVSQAGISVRIFHQVPLQQSISQYCNLMALLHIPSAKIPSSSCHASGPSSVAGSAAAVTSCCSSVHSL